MLGERARAQGIDFRDGTMVRGVEPATLRRVLLLMGIVACVVGLKVVG